MKFRNNIYTLSNYAETWQLCVCFQCLFARRVVHEKEEETTEREEEEEEDKSSDEGLLLQAHHAMERMEEFVHKVRDSRSSLTHTHLFHSSANTDCIIIEFICRRPCGEIKRMTSAHLTRAECSQLLLHEHAQSTNMEDIPVKPDAHLLAPAASHLNLVLRVCHMQRKRNRNRNWKPFFVTCAAMLSPINQLKFSLLFEPLLL